MTSLGTDKIPKTRNDCTTIGEEDIFTCTRESRNRDVGLAYRISQLKLTRDEQKQEEGRKKEEEEFGRNRKLIKTMSKLA